MVFSPPAETLPVRRRGAVIVQKECRKPAFTAAHQLLEEASVWPDYRTRLADYRSKDIAPLCQTAGSVIAHSCPAFQVNRQRHRSFDRLTKLLLAMKN
jgi:hypothetical protein